MILAGKEDERLGEMCSSAHLCTGNLILTALGSNPARFGGRLAVNRQFYYNRHLLGTYSDTSANEDNSFRNYIR
jgi:hypothetical protein